MNRTNLHFRQVRISLIGLVLTLMPFGLAQRGRAQEIVAPEPVEGSNPDDDKYSLVGTVVNSVTGEPIRRAAVVISGQASRATLTDSGGHFDFGDLAKGRVFVGVTKPGFFSEQGTSNGQIALQVSSDAGPVVLKMIPAGVIVGRVTSQDGDPIEGLIVRVISSQNLGGRRMSRDGLSQDLTDENGDFRLANLPAATYYIAVDQSQETTLSQQGTPNAREQVYAKVYYPGVSELSAATPLELQAGQEARANFTLTAEPIYGVSGTLHRYKDLAGLAFTRKAGDSFDFIQNAAVQDGKFQIKLPAGAYVVRGFLTTGVSLLTAGSSVVISSDSSTTQIVLLPAASIPIEVRTEYSGGVLEHAAASGGQGIGMSLQLVPSTPSLNQSAPWWTPPPTEIKNVEPGVYRVEINAVSPWWVKSVQCGNVDLLRDELTVAAGVQSVSIEVTLRDDAATVSGMVEQADQSEETTVLLVPLHNAHNLVKAVTTTQNKFQFQGVAPGDYALLAFGSVDQLEYANSDVLNPYLSAAAHVSLMPRGTVAVNLTVSPIGR